MSECNCQSESSVGNDYGAVGSTASAGSYFCQVISPCCKHCNRCPTCGRCEEHGQQALPYVLYYPYYPYYHPQPQELTTCASGITVLC